MDVSSYEELQAAVAERKWARGPWAGHALPSQCFQTFKMHRVASQQHLLRADSDTLCVLVKLVSEPMDNISEHFKMLWGMAVLHCACCDQRFHGSSLCVWQQCAGFPQCWCRMQVLMLMRQR